MINQNSNLGILKQITSNKDIIPFVSVTPELAIELLKLNTSNRPLQPRVANSYTREMAKGAWQQAGNTIKISKNFAIQDGQHQLQAIVQSGIPQEMSIITGLEPDAFNVMDTGKPRAGSDVAFMLGYDHPKQLAAAVKTDIYYNNSNRLRTNLGKDKVTNQEIKEWLDDDSKSKLMVACLEKLMNSTAVRKASWLAISSWAFIFYTLAKIHAGRATEFVDLLASGENLSRVSNSPIYFLREKLIAMRGYSAGGGSVNTEIKIKNVFRAWNLWRQNKQIKRFMEAKTFERPI